MLSPIQISSTLTNFLTCYRTTGFQCVPEGKYDGPDHLRAPTQRPGSDLVMHQSAAIMWHLAGDRAWGRAAAVNLLDRHSVRLASARDRWPVNGGGVWLWGCDRSVHDLDFARAALPAAQASDVDGVLSAWELDRPELVAWSVTTSGRDRVSCGRHDRWSRSSQTGGSTRKSIAVGGHLACFGKPFHFEAVA